MLPRCVKKIPNVNRATVEKYNEKNLNILKTTVKIYIKNFQGT